MERPMSISGRSALRSIAMVGAAASIWLGAARAEAPPPDRCQRERVERSQVGLASWYGERHQGRLTASGVPFDMRGLTAAHRTLPLGTRLRVTSLVNGRSVVVRLTDRGPYRPGRLIDLSQAAARAIGAVDRGVVRVRVDALPAFPADST
jgi:rare lipoprotein A